MECLHWEGSEIWKYRPDLPARAELTAVKDLSRKKRKEKITWSVKEGTFPSVRERCVKEKEFVSAQQIPIYHLLYTKHWASQQDRESEHAWTYPWMKLQPKRREKKWECWCRGRSTSWRWHQTSFHEIPERPGREDVRVGSSERWVWKDE